MPTDAVVTQSKVLEPIVGSRQGVYNALANIKGQYGVVRAVEYPHEVSRGVWRTVVAVPNLTPAKVAVRNGVKFRINVKIRPRVIGYVALGTAGAGMVGLAAWAVVTIVSWVIAHLSLIIGSAVVLVLLSGLLVGGRACVHADHH